MEKHKRLIELLLQRTIEGELDWKPTLDDDRLQVSFSAYTLGLAKESRRNRGGGYVEYVVEITNDEGKVIDTFSDSSLDEGSLETKWYEKMKDLYNRAVRFVQGADKAIDDILVQLGEIPF